MTEEEAKTKWCPMARTGLHSGNGGVAVNRSVAGDMRDMPFSVYDETRCLGSGCMAWRWSFAYLLAPDDLRGQPVETWPELTAFYSPGTKLARHGFCGLAGKEPR